MKKYFFIILTMLIAYINLNAEMSQNEKNVIIKKAITFVLPPTNSNQLSEQEVQHIQETITNKVYECHYEEAIDITLSGLEKFPQSFALQADLAALLGDCSEITPNPLKEKMLQRSKELFAKLLQEVENQPQNIFYSFKNEYYFRHALYREQYELGQMRVKNYWNTQDWNTQGVNGYYCQGVGAARYAQKLLEQKNKTLAFDYAQKALVAWAQYFSYKNDYYNAYVHYALALGILGYKEEMIRALQKSASIINKDFEYFEFKEIINFINNIPMYAAT